MTMRPLPNGTAFRTPPETMNCHLIPQGMGLACMPNVVPENVPLADGFVLDRQ